MSSAEKILRVFRCPHCRYTGFKPVLNEDDVSDCNLCSGTILPSPDLEHVRSEEEARKAIQRIVMDAQRSTIKSRHGLGVRKRVLNVVSDLSELNRGRGVSRSRVLEECEEANIDLDKARRFLKQLEEEGLILDIDGQLAPVESDEW